MQIEKAKAHLSVEIQERFAPYMDNSTELFKKMGTVIEHFRTLVDSLSVVEGENKVQFMSFMSLFTEYIELNTNNYEEVQQFYSYLTTQSNSLVTDYKIAAGVE